MSSIAGHAIGFLMVTLGAVAAAMVLGEEVVELYRLPIEIIASIARH